MKNTVKHIFSLIFALLLVFQIVVFVPSCDSGKGVGDAVKLSFKSADSYDYLKTLSGKTVTINGYMATSSPADGSYIFLMNLPYQSCPFCVPNTSQLSNTIEVYPEKNEKFSYTSQAIKITGTLEVAEQDNYFTDDFGYKFAFKIVDAEYKILKDEDLAVDVELWQKIAGSDIINDMYEMQNYIYFLSHWTTFFVNTHTTEKGETVKGYYLYPTDALHYLTIDGAQWNYGYKSDYFDNLISKIKSIDENGLSELVANVERAKLLAKYAISELENENYTCESKYIEKFDNTDLVYTLNNQEKLDAEYNAIYDQFAQWLASWEL